MTAATLILSCWCGPHSHFRLQPWNAVCIRPPFKAPHATTGRARDAAPTLETPLFFHPPLPPPPPPWELRFTKAPESEENGGGGRKSWHASEWEEGRGGAGGGGEGSRRIIGSGWGEHGATWLAGDVSVTSPLPVWGGGSSEDAPLSWETARSFCETQGAHPLAGNGEQVSAGIDLLRTQPAPPLLLFRSPSAPPLLQPWIICAGVSRTARSSPTCPMATWRTFRGPSRLSLLLLPPPPPLPRRPSPRRPGRRLRAAPRPRRGSPSRLSPAEEEEEEGASSAPSPMWWSRRPPRRGSWSTTKSRRPRSSRSSWWLTNPSRSGKASPSVCSPVPCTWNYQEAAVSMVIFSLPPNWFCRHQWFLSLLLLLRGGQIAVIIKNETGKAKGCDIWQTRWKCLLSNFCKNLNQNAAIISLTAVRKQRRVKLERSCPRCHLKWMFRWVEAKCAPALWRWAAAPSMGVSPRSLVAGHVTYPALTWGITNGINCRPAVH